MSPIPAVVFLWVTLLVGIHPWSAQVSRRSGLAAEESLPPELRSLIDKLQRGSAEDRAAAARLLGEMGRKGTPAIPFLIDLLKDTRPVRDADSVAAVASVSLARMGEPAALACLSALIEHPAREQSDMFRSTIGRFRDEEAIGLFITRMSAPDPKVRNTIVISLKYSTDARLVPGLIRCFTDGDRYVRLSSVGHFRRHRDLRAVEPLMVALEDDDDTMQIRAAQALGMQSDRRAVPNLRARMRDQEEEDRVRTAAAEALGRIGAPDAFDDLLPIVEKGGGFSGERYGAVLGLGHLGDRRASEILRSAIKDVDESSAIRIAAAKSLAQIEGKNAFQVITGIVTDASELPEVRFPMAINLVEATGGAIDDVDVVAALACWGYNTYPILESINVEDAITALETVAKMSSNAQVRLAAKQLLLKARKRSAQLNPTSQDAADKAVTTKRGKEDG